MILYVYMSITFEFLILSYDITIGLLGGLPIFQAHFRCKAKEAGKRLRSITAPGQIRWLPMLP